MTSKDTLEELYSILNALQQKQNEVRARGDIETVQTLSDTISRLRFYIETRRKAARDEITL